MIIRNIFIGIDIGGTWLKGVVYRETGENSSPGDVLGEVMRSEVRRVESGLSEHSIPEDFEKAVDRLVAELTRSGETVAGIGISTAGVVDYAGRRLEIAAPHLQALRSGRWTEQLERRFGAPVSLINDADAAAIGAAAAGYLKGPRTIGVMPVGTGIGFTLWRNGRRWAPHRMLPLIGSVTTPSGSYDQIAGVSKIAALAEHDLRKIFTDPEFAQTRLEYEKALAHVICTSCIIYHTDTILIGGGLAQAIGQCGYDLSGAVSREIKDSLAPFGKEVEIKVMPEGNHLPLAGAVLLAVGEHRARNCEPKKEYGSINTETPLDASAELHAMSANEITRLLWQTEQDAGERLEGSLSEISAAAEVIVRKIREGGRLIYVGAGTSGRLAAIDTVELSCTFGFPRDRVYTLISGGLSDAAIEIEDNFEEDASGVPEILLTGISDKDVVVGISVSGAAYYVRSALGAAQRFGAYTIFIQESGDRLPPFADACILLRSGREVISGSTRMKAGTATKKVLNFLSTTAMIILGRVHGPYMVEVECINDKLISRARHILHALFGLGENEAAELLAANGNDLRKTIDAITGKDPDE